MLGALASFSARHRWLVIAAWLFLLVGVGAAVKAEGGDLLDDMTLSDTDSQDAYDTLRADFPDMAGDGMDVVLYDEGGVKTPEVQRAVEDVLTEVRSDPEVTNVVSPFDPERPQVSRDGTTAIATVQFADRVEDIPADSLDAAQEAFAPLEDLGVQVEFGGPAVDSESEPGGITEIMGLVAAVVILLVAFGSVFAMVIPLLMALMALALTLMVIMLLAGQMTIATAAPAVAAMIGLGVGIDYALLIVTRHREGMHQGLDTQTSIRVAMNTAGRSVFVAATTVIVAVLALILIDIPFVTGLALAAATAVASTLLAATTLLPAVLSVLGKNLDRARVRKVTFDGSDGRVSFWHRWTKLVIRRRWFAIPLATAAFILLALPLFSMRLGTAGAGYDPEDTTTRQAYDLIEGGFGAGRNGPLIITSTYPDGTSEQEVKQASSETRGELAGTEGVAQVTQPRISPDGQTVMYTVIPKEGPAEETTQDLVNLLRDDVLPQAAPEAESHVGGATATNIDLADRIAERMPLFMAGVVGMAFLLLLIEFRSLLVPLTAITMNLLAVGAAYGPVVAVFQWGWWPADLLDVTPGPVESFAPIMLFAVLFGISTDYAVFLLTRVHEEFRRTGDAQAAIVAGEGATARVIAAAASVMVVVFGSFMFTDERVVNMFGFGLAVAVGMYALLAVFLLLPAYLAVLGKPVWWLPRWLSRILPKHTDHGHEDGDKAEEETETDESALTSPRHAAGALPPADGPVEPATAEAGDEDHAAEVERLRARLAEVEGQLAAARDANGHDDPLRALETLRSVLEARQNEPTWERRYRLLEAQRDDLKSRLAKIKEAFDTLPAAQASDVVHEMTRIAYDESDRAESPEAPRR